MKNTEIVVNTAIRLAEGLDSTAIIVSGDIEPELMDTRIPVYFASRKQKNLFDHLVASSKNTEEKIKGNP
ncbi:MAG: hypothetical protein R2741_12450 [Methanolobus sp.]